MIYNSWDIVRDKLKLVVLGHLLLCPHLKIQKFKTLKKWKILLEISSYCLHMRLKNHNYMMYGSSDTEWDMHIFFCHFGPFFTHLPHHQQYAKSKFWKDKKYREILLVYNSVPQMTIISCMVSEIWITTNRIFCHFAQFSALLHYPTNSHENQTFQENF